MLLSIINKTVANIDTYVSLKSQIKCSLNSYVVSNSINKL